MYNKKETNNNEHSKGITLIALVVTIIVLLLLAGISIMMLTGENGIIKNAAKAKIEHTHASLWEAMEMEYSNWQLDKHTEGVQKRLIQYLQDKNIISKEEASTGGYIIDAETLLGESVSLGKGKDETNDVYKLEDASSEETEVDNQNKKYKVNYYGPSGDRELGVLADNISQAEDSNLPYIILNVTVSMEDYFEGKTEELVEARAKSEYSETDPEPEKPETDSYLKEDGSIDYESYNKVYGEWWNSHDEWERKFNSWYDTSKYAEFMNDFNSNQELHDSTLDDVVPLVFEEWKQKRIDNGLSEDINWEDVFNCTFQIWCDAYNEYDDYKGYTWNGDWLGYDFQSTTINYKTLGEFDWRTKKLQVKVTFPAGAIRRNFVGKRYMCFGF